MTTYAMIATNTSVVMYAAARNTPSMILLDRSLLMRPFLPWERARLMRSREEVVSTVVSTESDIAYPLFFLEIRRTTPTSVAEMINRTTPMPNSAERCRPEE